MKLGQLKLRLEDYYTAKEYAEKANEICNKHNENYFQGDWVSLLDRVNEQIRMTSRNVFIFLKAFPLVDPNDREHIGPITQKNNYFKDNVVKNMKGENKILQVKFDILTRDTLKNIRDHGCRVLHLSSEDAKLEHLWAEGAYGELDLIGVSELRELIFPVGAMLSIDVVVLAIPKSRMLAEVFVALGVPHVIFFDFEEEFHNEYTNYDSSINAPYVWIYSFCEEFYKRLVKGESVTKAWEIAKDKMKKVLREANKTLKIWNLNDEFIGVGPVILPEDFDHDQSLFGSKDWKSIELEKGKLIDMSRIRGNTNVPKPYRPFTGRRIEQYKLAKYLCENKIIWLSGPSGIGKSHLAQVVSYFMNSHYLFNSGNYYVDLTNVSSAEQCKKFLKDQNVEYNVQDTLLILDHVDQIWKKHGAQFRWWVIDVANRFGVTILLISRESITEQLQDSNVIEVKGIEIGPINEYESADLLIALTKRVITLNEIHCDSTSMTLHSALEFEPNLRNCSGVPQYIRILADLLEYNTFDTINIKKEIPTWVRQEMKRQKVALENSYSDQHEHQRHKMQKSKISSFKNSSQSSFHNDKKENKRNRKKRERKEKKMESKISGSPSYISKNEKRRLRVIQEEKEDSNKHVNSPHKKEEYLKEGDYYFDDDADQQYNISLSMPKKHNSQKSNEARKNESFIVENKNAIDPKMKKNLSFKIDSLNNDYENNPITPLKTKKSKGKSKNKSRDSKKTNTKKKDSFIPLRDSQVDEFLFFAPTTQYNKDDFNIKEPSKQDFNLDQPMMKKKGVSFNASINKREPLEPNELTQRCKTAGLSLPNKVSLYVLS